MGDNTGTIMGYLSNKSWYFSVKIKVCYFTRIMGCNQWTGKLMTISASSISDLLQGGYKWLCIIQNEHMGLSENRVSQ